MEQQNAEAIKRLKEGLNDPKLQSENTQKLLLSSIKMLEDGYTVDHLLGIMEAVNEAEKQTQSIYDTNPTMQLVGYQYCIMPDTNAGKALLDIINAWGYKNPSSMPEDLFMCCMDCLNYGIIEGKRQERQKRKAMAI